MAGAVLRACLLAHVAWAAVIELVEVNDNNVSTVLRSLTFEAPSLLWSADTEFAPVMADLEMDLWTVSEVCTRNVLLPNTVIMLDFPVGDDLCGGTLNSLRRIAKQGASAIILLRVK